MKRKLITVLTIGFYGGEKVDDVLGIFDFETEMEQAVQLALDKDAVMRVEEVDHEAQ